MSLHYIKNNVKILKVEESKLSVDSKRTTLKFGFKYDAIYEPKIALIELNGEVMFLVDKNIADEVLKSWKKDKKIKADFMYGLMNHILSKCNVEAVILSRDMSLPAPIPLPKLK